MSDGQEANPTLDCDPGVARVGGKIDRYKLISVLGEGGCGIVYLAEQRTPVTRRVALKVIKPGMDTRQVIARFEAERQALALLDHPNIASVHDAGTTKTGRPYFVMEYVKGVSITEHCDREKLGIEARLGLFLQVCEAVQYAHLKGVIHRDIKPSNVQVAIHGSKAVPKIIDFGLAKALSQLLTERTLVTEQGQMVGTPEYMSPEQAEMTNQDIDTRTDIYSLGAVLYELLTGTLPFDPDTLREGGAENIRRTIREKDPKTPSTRLSMIAGENSQKVARSRNTDLRTLSRRLHGDLDWITIRAMEKDRMRRYQTAQALAEDIQRHLNDEPVLAGPPSKIYRMKKFLRKHRALAAGLAAVLAVLIAGVVVSTLFAVRAEHARVEAEVARAEAESVSSFLRNDVLASMNPGMSTSPLATSSREATVRSLLDGASEKLEGRFPDQPLVEASIRGTLGRTYTDLGLYGRAESHLERARAACQTRLGAEDPTTLECTMRLGWLYYRQNRYDEAETLLTEAMKGFERVRGAEDPNTLRSMVMLGWVYNSRGSVAEAERLFVRRLEVSERVLGPEGPVGVALSAYGLGYAHNIQGHYGEAERLFKRSLKINRRERGEDDLETLHVTHSLGALYKDLGRFEEADQLLEKVLKVRRGILGEEHPHTLEVRSNLGLLRIGQGRYEEADQLLEKVLSARRRILGEEHPHTLEVRSALGGLRILQGRYEEAELLLTDTLKTARATEQSESPSNLVTMTTLGFLYFLQGRYDEAEPLVVPVLEFARPVLGEEHWAILGGQCQVGRLYTAQGRYDKAEEHLAPAAATSRRVLGQEHPTTLDCTNALAVLRSKQKRFEEAESLFTEAWEGRRQKLGEDHPDTLESLYDFGVMTLEQGRHEQAETKLLAAYEGRTKKLGPEHPMTLKSIHTLIQLYDAWHKPEQAEEYRGKLPREEKP